MNEFAMTTIVRGLMRGFLVDLRSMEESKFEFWKCGCLNENGASLLVRR